MRSEREKQREATGKVIGKESSRSRKLFRPSFKTDPRTAAGTLDPLPPVPVGVCWFAGTASTCSAR